LNGDSENAFVVLAAKELEGGVKLPPPSTM